MNVECTHPNGSIYTYNNVIDVSIFEEVIVMTMPYKGDIIRLANDKNIKHSIINHNGTKTVIER
jgi:hypothetical protein